MASLPDPTTSFAGDLCGGDLLPLSPFNSLHYNFGMLLGVEDFETQQAYPRGKTRLHNAWLHREGVIWGFGVTVDNDRGEIRVKPGLALDAAGHELHLDVDACINVGEWFDKHEKDPDFTIDTSDGKKKFSARVVIRFKACLNRQIPALMEPCANGASGTAYSRVVETLEILLLPNKAPQPVYPYHRLRLMFGLTDPRKKESSTDNTDDDQAVLDEVARILTLPVANQPAGFLNAFHRYAALDEIDLQPATSRDGVRLLLFPGQDDDPVLLADVTELTLTKQDQRWVLTGGTVDSSVRPSHVATTTIQDLLCGRFLAAANNSEAEDTGPRIDPALMNLSVANEIMFTLDKEILEASLKPEIFSVTSFDSATGWQKLNVVSVEYGGSETNTVKLKLDTNMNGRVRLIVSGTGPAPLLGVDKVPLAGAVGGPPGTPHEGHDFVYMQDFVSGEIDPGDAPEPKDSSESPKDEVIDLGTPEAISPSRQSGRPSRSSNRRK